MLGFGPVSGQPIAATGFVGPGAPLALQGVTTCGAQGEGGLASATSLSALVGLGMAAGQGRGVLVNSLSLMGTTLGGGQGAAALVASTGLQMSKLAGYAVAGPKPGSESLSKLAGYAVTNYAPPTRLVASKIGAYAVTMPLQARQSLSKLGAYGVVYSKPAPPNLFPTLPNIGGGLPIGFPVEITPTFATVVGGIPAGRDMQAYQQTLPIWKFTLNFEVLRDQTQNSTLYPRWAGFTEYTQAVQTFVAAVGQAGQFLFDAWWDDSRKAQEIAVGDGVTGNFPIVRTWGFGALEFNEPIGYINDLMNVYFNGTPVSASNYFVASDGYTLTFTSAPGAGVVITADFSFYYLLQFDMDQAEFSQFMYDLWSVKLKMRSILH